MSIATENKEEPMNSVWFCNPTFKGLGVIPEGFERLDDLVLGRKKMALAGICHEAFARHMPQMPEGEAAKFITSLGTEEELADWCWRLLKDEFRSGPQGAQAVLALIAKHAQA